MQVEAAFLVGALLGLLVGRRFPKRLPEAPVLAPPLMLEDEAEPVVEETLPAVVEEILIPEGPKVPYGRFRVVRHHAGTDTLLYPTRPAQDSGAEARRVLEEYQPRYLGEFAVLYDGEIERGRKGAPEGPK